MRPGNSDSSVPNCSATTSGAWLGNITPPEPTRIRGVAAARALMRTGGAELAQTVEAEGFDTFRARVQARAS